MHEFLIFEPATLAAILQLNALLKDEHQPPSREDINARFAHAATQLKAEHGLKVGIIEEAHSCAGAGGRTVVHLLAESKQRSVSNSFEMKKLFEDLTAHQAIIEALFSKDFADFELKAIPIAMHMTQAATILMGAQRVQNATIGIAVKKAHAGNPVNNRKVFDAARQAGFVDIHNV